MCMTRSIFGLARSDQAVNFFLTVSVEPFSCRLNAAKILIAGCTGLAVEVRAQ